MACRIIREHRVFGRVVNVKANSVEEARGLASRGDVWAWEATEVSPGNYEVFVARHQDAFALND